MLVARYPMTDHNPTTVPDTVDGRDGTIVSAPVYGTFGNGVNRLRFDGVDDFVDMPGDAFWRSLINNFTPFSIAMWVQAGTGATGVFVSTWNVPTQAGCRIMVGDPSFDRVSFLLTNPTASAFKQVFTTGSFIGDSVTHHLVVTHDGTGTVAGMKIYKDGVLQPLTVNSDGDISGVLPGDWSDNFHIAGNFGILRQPVGGDVGDVQLYDTELAQAEITFLFSNPGQAIGEAVARKFSPLILAMLER